MKTPAVKIAFQRLGVFAFCVAFFVSGVFVATKTGFNYLPWICIPSALWATWDSRRAGVTKYRSLMAMEPVGILLSCLLIWWLAFPWYVIFRWSILEGTARMKE